MDDCAAVVPDEVVPDEAVLLSAKAEPASASANVMISSCFTFVYKGHQDLFSKFRETEMEFRRGGAFESLILFFAKKFFR
ncbi:MAG TPA: hypothetical protein VG733_07055, partial [Chthoniobacteraceae bacterium]|nr:hypothetical protein [Chthoniobacteraceae bacterium]